MSLIKYDLKTLKSFFEDLLMKKIDNKFRHQIHASTTKNMHRIKQQTNPNKNNKLYHRTCLVFMSISHLFPESLNYSPGRKPGRQKFYFLIFR